MKLFIRKIKNEYLTIYIYIYNIFENKNINRGGIMDKYRVNYDFCDKNSSWTSTSREVEAASKEEAENIIRSKYDQVKNMRTKLIKKD